MTPHEGIFVVSACCVILTAAVVVLVVKERRRRERKLPPFQQSENGRPQRIRDDEYGSGPEDQFEQIEEPTPLE